MKGNSISSTQMKKSEKATGLGLFINSQEVDLI
jgi:hypothetical protein